MMMNLTAEEIEASRRYHQQRLAKKQENRERQRLVALAQVEAVVPRIVHRYHDIQRVYLFGSILKPGIFRPNNSDVDIAVEGLAPEDYSSLWQDLESALPDLPVDLRDLSPDTVFGKLVILRGQKIYERVASISESRN